MPRLPTVRERRSTTASSVGPTKASGAGYSTPWPMLADHQHSCSSIPRLFVRIAVRRAEKGGTQPGHRQVARRADHQDPRPDRWDVQANRLPPDWRQRRRLQGGRGIDRPDARDILAERRQGLRQRRHSSSGQAARRFRQYPAEGKPDVEETASRRTSTGTATPSSACSAGSRTSAALQPDTIDWLQTSSQRSASQQPSVTGYESGPSDWGGLKRPQNSARRINQITTIQKIEIGHV
jgi:hypothetical protein